MDENTEAKKKSYTLDWLVSGTLRKLGETLDQFTGRNWKPSSNLATSELIERLKKLLDSEAKNDANGMKFVPHHIKLLMQWDKFSTDAENPLRKLENELLTAAVDHINDRRFHTYAPLKLEIKTDYFTEGVKLQASFDEFAEDENESEAEVNLPVTDLKNVVLTPTEVENKPEMEFFTVSFTVKDKPRQVKLAFAEKDRRSVGRTRENDLCIDDESVSKHHASLVLSSEKQLMVADTGSTNGTFINGNRIAYGRAFAVGNADKLKFGSIEVSIFRLETEIEEAEQENSSAEAENLKSAESLTILDLGENE